LCVVLVFSPYALSQGSNISEGEELFDRYCAGCHGNSGVGQVPEDPGGGWDADGMRVAPSLNSKGHSWHHSPEMLFMYIKEGSVDDTSPMPSFGAILKDAEVESLVLYVESLWSKEIRKKHRERFGEHPHIFKEER
jgi:mono/diheme cytochrome c family protein